MEKLIELLNEYNRNVLKWSDKWELKNSIDNPWTKYISLSSVWAWKIYLWIISKEYWFIKWLVENDKIDLDIVREKLWTPCFTWYKKWEIITVKDVEDYKQVLMLLAISDTPIDDLILYLNQKENDTH